MDDDPSGGRFLLAGSATPPATARLHTGAGRIVGLRMRPLSMAERRLVTPTVSLSALLAGEATVVDGDTTFALADYVEEILRSGFPGIRTLPLRARSLQLDSYLMRLVDRELPEAGISVRRPSTLRAWLAAYAAATSTDAGYSTILDAATAGEGEKPARQTVDTYRDHLTRIFILDPVPPWQPTFAPLKRLTKTPKHHLVDPALAARLVGADAAGLLSGQGTRLPTATGTWLGALFESLVTQSVRIYAEAADAQIGHLRTKNTEHEVDLIVEGPNRRVVAVEVKLTDTVSDADVRHLSWLSEQLGPRVVERVVITTGRHAYRRPDGVAVVPLALLGP